MISVTLRGIIVTAYFYKMNLGKKIFATALFCFFIFIYPVQSQIRFSMNYGLDFYQHFTNPQNEGDTTFRTAGNAITNVIIGPKFYFGYKDFSISGEAEINWGITALSLKDFKGMGALSLPLMAKLNFGGLSALTDDYGKFGVSLGGGVEYAMTEIYGLTEDYIDISVRNMYKVYIGELQIGYLAESGVASFYIRYGKGDFNSSLFHIGYTVSYIFPTKDSRGSRSKIFRPSNGRK